jgi:formylglycine-generating enzyme
MVAAEGPTGRFCIDSTEVTNDHYLEFLSEPDVAPQPAYCNWNTDYMPRFPIPNEPNKPVVGVDFCDARAFCEWSGKRLCGRIGGGETPFDSYADANESQWYAACSGGGTRIFPYGNNYDGDACNGSDRGDGALLEAGTVTCEGGVPGLFDMSGNAWEWEHACDGTTGQADNCRLRSGEWTNPSGFLRCDYGGFYITRDFATQSIGIRCCGP